VARSPYLANGLIRLYLTSNIAIASGRTSEIDPLHMKVICGFPNELELHVAIVATLDPALMRNPKTSANAATPQLDAKYNLIVKEQVADVINLRLTLNGTRRLLR
jgi:hypothetical protein